MIRELLTEKSISLVFGAVEGTDEVNSVNIASVIQVHIYDCITGIMMSKIYKSPILLLCMSVVYI